MVPLLWCCVVVVLINLRFFQKNHSPEPVLPETIGVVELDIDLNPFAILAKLVDDADVCDAISVLPY